MRGRVIFWMLILASNWLHHFAPWKFKILRFGSVIAEKTNLALYSPYYAEACNEFTVPISAS